MAMAAADEQCDGNGADGGAGGATSLAEDEAFEMLTWVSLDDLACRDVCAHWRRLTYEAAFAPLHLRRAAAGGFVSGYLVQGLARNRYSATFVSSTSGAEVSLDFLPCSPSVRIEAVSAHRGLACCVDPTAFSLSSGAKPSSRCYYMCKPATKQWRALPSPRLRFPTAATAMIARPAPAGADLKILRLSIPTLRDRLRC
ncbi:F-box protein At5g41720-like [Brachypodium distachyon]|uniref:F-box protein At5g41720-like n=1 Tax=Brachypodium distachyon TaxID=15368 RepID=UPI000D0DA71F|nr:F-box protein At5g41720-like [Brachypodium distachyon]|eukprot:XP_010236782.2 F-box protein At5g41720-like [Brachypodium distachyon]